MHQIQIYFCFFIPQFLSALHNTMPTLPTRHLDCQQFRWRVKVPLLTLNLHQLLSVPRFFLEVFRLLSIQWRGCDSNLYVTWLCFFLVKLNHAEIQLRIFSPLTSVITKVSVTKAERPVGNPSKPPFAGKIVHWWHNNFYFEAEHALFLVCVTLSSFSGACEFLQTSWHCSHDCDYLLVTKDLNRRFLAHHPLWSRNNHKPAGKYRLLPTIYGCQRVNDHPSRPVRLRPTSCQNDVVYSLMLQSP